MTIRISYIIFINDNNLCIKFCLFMYRKTLLEFHPSLHCCVNLSVSLQQLFVKLLVHLKYFSVSLWALCGALSYPALVGLALSCLQKEHIHCIACLSPQVFIVVYTVYLPCKHGMQLRFQLIRTVNKIVCMDLRMVVFVCEWTYVSSDMQHFVLFWYL